jgi:formylglycine-generating enzyme required for sulfatase activity
LWSHFSGTTTPFSTGRTITPEQANFNGELTYGGSAKGINRGKTVEVGTFAANAFGLLDMHGNVWEWVQDCYKDSYAGAPADGSAASDVAGCSRVLRGGSWYIHPSGLRSASRTSTSPNVEGFDRNDGLGFRVARTLSP